MYQAVRQPVDPPGVGSRVVLVIDLPTGLGSSAADVARMADDFGVTLSHYVPGARAHRAVVSTRADTPAQTGLTVDLANRQVSIDGHSIRLAYREFQLLAYLAATPRRTVSRAALLQNVWSDRRPGPDRISDRTVDSHVRRLRAKLGDYAHEITTVRGQGYRFDPGADERIQPA